MKTNLFRSRFGFKFPNEKKEAINALLLSVNEWTHISVVDEGSSKFLPPGAGCSNVLSQSFREKELESVFLVYYTHDGGEFMILIFNLR